MSSCFITIDGGTTNTRISLVKERTVLDRLRLHLGAKDGISGSDDLARAVKDGICLLLGRNGLAEADIVRILAAGMITSEYGLYDLPHIPAPAGIRELHRGMREVLLKEISGIPFVFIPGVKMQGAALDETDIMRGEETELMGIMEDHDCIYILPGSHSKIIRTNASGQIAEFSTLFTGEMTAALSGHTILRGAVSLKVQKIDRDFLIEGRRYCEQAGINKALFKVRMLKTQLGGTEEQIYSFFLGIMLHGEIREILRYSAAKAVIGGRRQVSGAMAILLRESAPQCNVICLEEEQSEQASIQGMLNIYQYRDR